MHCVRAFGLALVLASIAFIIGGCGKSPSSPSPTPTPEPTTTGPPDDDDAVFKKKYNIADHRPDWVTREHPWVKVRPKVSETLLFHFINSGTREGSYPHDQTVFNQALYHAVEETMHGDLMPRLEDGGWINKWNGVSIRNDLDDKDTIMRNLKGLRNAVMRSHVLQSDFLKIPEFPTHWGAADSKFVEEVKKFFLYTKIPRTGFFLWGCGCQRHAVGIAMLRGNLEPPDSNGFIRFFAHAKGGMFAVVLANRGFGMNEGLPGNHAMQYQTFDSTQLGGLEHAAQAAAVVIAQIRHAKGNPDMKQAYQILRAGGTLKTFSKTTQDQIVGNCGWANMEAALKSVVLGSMSRQSTHPKVRRLGYRDGLWVWKKIRATLTAYMENFVNHQTDATVTFAWSEYKSFKQQTRSIKVEMQKVLQGALSPQVFFEPWRSVPREVDDASLLPLLKAIFTAAAAVIDGAAPTKLPDFVWTNARTELNKVANFAYKLDFYSFPYKTPVWLSWTRHVAQLFRQIVAKYQTSWPGYGTTMRQELTVNLPDALSKDSRIVVTPTDSSQSFCGPLQMQIKRNLVTYLMGIGGSGCQNAGAHCPGGWESWCFDFEKMQYGGAGNPGPLDFKISLTAR